MRATIKKSRRTSRLAGKKSASGESRSAISEPIYKSEPAYININEHQAEIAAKSRFLWIIVGVFGVFLAVFWLIMLRINIQKQTADIGFAQISSQIAQSLARFDTEIKDRAAPQAISADDLAAIKNDIESQIKSNPDSSLWPTHELPGLKISLQYPNNWNFNSVIDGIMISDVASSTNPDNQSGQIFAGKKSNTGKQPLAEWIEKNNAIVNSYSKNQSIFINNSVLDTMGFIRNTSSTNSLDEILLINSTSTKTVYIFQVSMIGDLNYYRPLTTEILRTMKILK